MDIAVIVGEKREEVKSNSDPAGVMEVAITKVKKSGVLTLSFTES